MLILCIFFRSNIQFLMIVQVETKNKKPILERKEMKNKSGGKTKEHEPTTKEISIEAELATDLLYPEHEHPVVCCLNKLPEKVVDFILENCAIVSFDPKYKGAYRKVGLGGYTEDVFYFQLIILNRKNQDEYIVAHEIAHAWLEHENTTTSKQHQKQESAANKQAEKWGFKNPLKSLKQPSKKNKRKPHQNR